MLNLKEDDYRNAVASTLISLRDSINTLTKQINNTLNPNQSSGVIETQTNQGSDISALQTFRGSIDIGNRAYAIVTGTDHRCYYRYYNGSTWGANWIVVGSGTFSEQVTFQINQSPTGPVVDIFGKAVSNGSCWHYRMNALTQVKITDWEDLVGDML